MDKPQFMYVVYISTTPENLWNALIDSKMTRQYWQHDNVSDWKAGSKWEHRQNENEKIDLVGKVVEVAPPRRLVITWSLPADENRPERHSRVTFEIEPYRSVTRLTVVHDQLEPGSDMEKGIVDGWPKVLSSLKSLLESGHALPRLW
jgi:uncharacterized protein YndB with AHSA1/START domain